MLILDHVSFSKCKILTYLRYLCLFAHSGAQDILCCEFLFCFYSSCVPYVMNIFDNTPRRKRSHAHHQYTSHQL